jgi:hypothetical protein
VLLAFFSGLGDEQADFLKKYLGIHNMESVLFVLNEPSWGKAKKHKNFGWFWGAMGVVREFLDRLHRVSLAPIKIPRVRVPLGLARTENRDHFFLYIPSAEKLRELAKLYETQQAFFAALESTYISDLIREVRVVVSIGPDAQSLSFRELSEGEQQILMVLGLLKFTQQEESLFLLDEPDTHLNPAWSVEYIDLLNSVVGDSQNSHFVITSHDPLVIAGRTKNQVQLLQRDAKGNIEASTPDEDPRGMGVAALLTSEIYGLRSELDLYTLEMLERKRRLSLQDELSAEEIDELSRINAYVKPLDFIDSDRDPLYPSWVKLVTAVTEELGIEGGSLSREQRAKLAERLVQLENAVLKGLR